MNHRFLFPLSLSVALCAAAPLSRSLGQTTAVADAEVQKCQDKIGTVQREILNHYDDALQELQFSFQKAADLEGALSVREERQRLAADNSLTEKNFVNDPKALRTLQTQTVAKLHELVASLIGEALPRLIEIKKNLTMTGKLDEAVAVRTAIDQLQNNFTPTAHPDAGSVVSADVVLQAYAADRPRADKTYKGQKVNVRGILGGFRQDPSDAKTYFLYLTGTAGNSWIQCAFPVGEYHFKEEKQFNNSILVITSKEEPNGLRVQKGQALDIRGVFDGWDEVVKMVKCELGK